MGELIDLAEYREMKRNEENAKIEEEIEWLKKKLDNIALQKSISIFPESDEYFHWHPPGIIGDYESDGDLTVSFVPSLDGYDGYFDWEKD